MTNRKKIRRPQSESVASEDSLEDLEDAEDSLVMEIQSLQDQLQKTGIQYAQVVEQYNLERKRSAELGSQVLAQKERSDTLQSQVNQLKQEMENAKTQQEFISVNASSLFLATYSAIIHGIIARGGMSDRGLESKSKVMARQVIALTEAILQAFKGSDLIQLIGSLDFPEN